jgi:peptide/nickel transport system permease protein
MRALRRLWGTSGTFQLGVVLLAILIALAVLHPFLNWLIGGDQDPIALSAFDRWEVPNAYHWLGTDRYGRDILAMSLTGLTTSLEIAAIAGFLSTFIGVIVAFVAGYKGGWIDAVLRTSTDMFLVIPTFPLLLTLSAYVRNVSLLTIALMLSAFSWPFAARPIRSYVLSLRSRPYVELARVTNLNDFQIIFQELVPNLLPYLGVGLANAGLGAVFALVGLEVIGLGPANVIDLGILIQYAISWGAMSLGAWPIFVAPVVFLSFVFISVNLINVGLEEIYNPRLRCTAGA